MKQPGFFDSPQVWLQLGSLAMGLVLVAGHTFHGTPYSLQDVDAIAGAGIMAWLFTLARYYVVFR